MNAEIVGAAASLACLALGTRDLARRPHASPHLLGGIAGRYDASRPGRRLAALLWRAHVHTTPARWRCGQLLVAVQAIVVLLLLGVAPLPAGGLAMTVSRTGGRVVLWLRRTRSRAAVDAATPALARALGTELAAWGSGAQAVSGARRRCTTVPAATRILDAAAARVALGGDAALSLRRAITEMEPRLPPSSPARVVATVFAMHRHDAAATAAALDRLAAALDDDRAVRREVSATVGEVRASTVAVPLIAALTAGILFMTDPAALGAALSFPLFPLLIGAVLVVALAAAVARRLLVA